MAQTNPAIKHGHGAYNIFTMVLDKLERNNYLCWRNQFECTLREKKFMKFVNGTKSAPTPRLDDDTSNPEYEEWIANDDMVLGWIKATVANQYHLMTLKCKSTYKARITWSNFYLLYATPWFW